MKFLAACAFSLVFCSESFCAQILSVDWEHKGTTQLHGVTDPSLCEFASDALDELRGICEISFESKGSSNDLQTSSQRSDASVELRPEGRDQPIGTYARNDNRVLTFENDLFWRAEFFSEWSVPAKCDTDVEGSGDWSVRETIVIGTESTSADQVLSIFSTYDLRDTQEATGTLEVFDHTTDTSLVSLDLVSGRRKFADRFAIPRESLGNDVRVEFTFEGSAAESSWARGAVISRVWLIPEPDGLGWLLPVAVLALEHRRKRQSDPFSSARHSKPGD